MKKFIIAAILILMVLGAVAFFNFRNKGNELRFRTERVTRGDVLTTVTATGTVNAVTTVLSERCFAYRGEGRVCRRYGPLRLRKIHLHEYLRLS